MIEIAAIALLFFLFSLISRKAARAAISAPMFFLGAGILLASELIDVVNFEDAASILLFAGTAALGLSFFGDAARIDVAALRGNLALPANLLLVGVPLAFLFGSVLAIWLLDLFWVEAALVAIILTPADTGLITVVLSSSRVPSRIRQALNVESSLNDGLTTPIAAILIALAQTGLGQEAMSYGLRDPLQQIAVAVLVGVLVGGAGGWITQRAMREGWVAPSYRGLLFPSLTFVALALAAGLNGNYFIASFVAGAALGTATRGFSPAYSRFSETLAQLLSLVVILFVGAKVVELRALITWHMVLYAMLSLTAVRMLAVAIAIWREGLQRQTLLFLGWFGPRGLASVVLALILVGTLQDIPHGETVVAVVTVTVSLSVVLHGISAVPLVVRYGQYMERVAATAPEKQPVEEIPLRLGWSHLGTHAEARASTWEAERAARESRWTRR